MSSTHNPTKDTRCLVNRAAAISGCLRETEWSNRYLHIDIKDMHRPIMTYGIEVRKDTSKTKRILRTIEMKILEIMTRKTLRNQLRNQQTRNRCAVQDVVRWGRQRRRHWHERVKRMNVTRLARIALEGIPTGRRPLIRPPKRWRDS